MKRNRCAISDKAIRKSIIATLLTGCGAMALHAQTLQAPDSLGPRGVVPYGSYAPSDLDNIDTVYGGLTYRVPLVSLPVGRAGQTVSLPLVYNSNLYDIDQQYDQNGNLYNYLGSAAGGGWRYGHEYGLALVQNPAWYDGGIPRNCSYSYTFRYYQLSAIFPDGSHHLLRLYGSTDDQGNGFYQELPGADNYCPSNQSGDFVYYTNDGSYLKVVISASVGTSCGTNAPDPCWTTHPWTMYFPDGTQVTGYGEDASSIIDKNGNAISIANVDTST